MKSDEINVSIFPRRFNGLLFNDTYRILPKHNNTLFHTGNITICTLYKSCSEVTTYKHPDTSCEECKITYNHCPWVAGLRALKRSKGFNISSRHYKLIYIYCFIIKVVLRLKLQNDFDTPL